METNPGVAGDVPFLYGLGHQKIQVASRMKMLIILLRKEFSQILRNPAIIRLIFVMPVIQLIVLPNAADYEIKNIQVHVIDHDHSTLSRRLIEQIRASGYFRLVGYGNDPRAAREDIEHDRADLFMEIPPAFERNLIRENEQKILIAVNAINGVKGNLGGAYLNNLVRQFNGDVRMEWIAPGRTEKPAVISVTSSNWYNPEMNYKFFMVPGILVLLLTMVGLNLTALNIVREKEIGTIEQINVSPISRTQFILGKLIPFWILGLVVLSIGFAIVRGIYGIVPLGSFLTIYAFAAVYLLVILGMGLLVSNYSGTQQQAMLVSFFIMMVFILLSGLYTSIESMPEWAKWITRFNPVSYFIEVMRRVVLKGAVLSDVKQELAIVSGYAVLMNAWAVVSYRKRTL
jgi:ABC-2 type transport system permease protein